MTVVFEILLFVIGGFLGTWWFSVIILPLFYGLPRSLYWTAKGTLKAKSILVSLGSFTLWTVLFTLVAMVLIEFFPNAAKYLYNSPGFYFGQWFGVLGSLMKAFSKSGRKDLREDFWSAMARFQREEVHNNRREMTP
jgi:hypothetical protein